MPRKALPDEIERNDVPLEDATPAERDVVDKLPDLWERHDTITSMADKLGWSSSHVGACWRKYFRPVGESEDNAPTPDAEYEPHAPSGSDVGVEARADENDHTAPNVTVTIRVNEIPDNEREALAFIRGVKALSAN